MLNQKKKINSNEQLINFLYKNNNIELKIYIEHHYVIKLLIEINQFDL